MALRVWLPLNGTLENKGVSNYTITSSGSSAVTSGKIGSCMKITSTTSMGYTPDFNNNPLSLGGWFKFNLAEIKAKVDTLTYSSSATSPTGNLLGNTSYGGIGLVWVGNNHYSSGTFSSMSVFATLRTGSVNQSTSSIAIEFDKWIHIMLTWDPNTHILSLYKDGVLVNSKTFSAFTNGVSRVLALNYQAIYGGNGPSASIPIYCNDIRIYDHCLSAAEVREISQGLVLHYKLDHFTQPNLLTGNINLIARWTADGVTRTQDGNSIKVVNNNSGNHRIYNGVSNVWTTSGQKFTVSFDAKATANGHIIQASRSLGDLAPETTLTTEWKHYTVQLTNTASVTDGTLSIQSKTSSGTFWIRNVKLEKGTVESRFILPGENDTSIKDSSGYGHNGTITGTPTLNSNTPRYSSCINLTSGQKISVTGLLTSSDPIWTANFWVKMYSNTYTAWADVITFKGNKPIRVEVSNSNGKNLAWYNYPLGTSNGIPISNINYDEWNMITMVWNGTSILSYFNGVLKYTAAISGTAWTPNGEMTIGDTGMYMYMSDVRIYCTALSVDDILSLYHTAAKVDNLGGLHTFELNENNGNEPNAKFVNSSATSVSYDAVTDTYTIVSPVGTSGWGYGVRLADTPALWVPYGKAYRWTAEVFVPIALTVNTDYNNTASTTWSGNDNDLVLARLAQSNAIPANTWTRITRGSINTNTNNTSQLPIRDYSSLGLVTNGQSNPVTWKVRNLQWYLIEDTFETKIKKTGQTKSSHFSEMNFNKFDISKKNHSVESFNLIEK